MKKDKFQITMPELQKLIKEEYASMVGKAKRTEEIQNKIKAINEELKTLPTTISEVEASGTKKVKATGWTGEGEGDVKYGEKFEKIGTHLKEDGGIEMGEDSMEMDMGEDSMEMDMGYFELKFAELGKELDAKVGGESMDVEAGEEVIAGEEAEEEVEIAADEEVEMVAEEIKEDEEVEMVAEEKIKEGEEEIKEGEEAINEDLNEPIEGETPAQDSEARFNDQMDKDNHVKESVSKKGTTILSEGYSAERKSKLDNELERMKKLAKI